MHGITRPAMLQGVVSAEDSRKLSRYSGDLDRIIGPSKWSTVLTKTKLQVFPGGLSGHRKDDLHRCIPRASSRLDLQTNKPHMDLTSRAHLPYSIHEHETWSLWHVGKKSNKTEKGSMQQQVTDPVHLFISKV